MPRYMDGSLMCSGWVPRRNSEIKSSNLLLKDARRTSSAQVNILRCRCKWVAPQIRPLSICREHQSDSDGELPKE